MTQCNCLYSHLFTVFMGPIDYYAMCLNTHHYPPGTIQLKHFWSIDMFNANHLHPPPTHTHTLLISVRISPALGNRVCTYTRMQTCLCIQTHMDSACLIMAEGALVFIDPPPLKDTAIGLSVTELEATVTHMRTLQTELMDRAMDRLSWLMGVMR